MTVETKDLAKAEIEFLSDKCEMLEKKLEIAESWFREIVNNVNTYFEKDNRSFDFTLDVLMCCGVSAILALHEIKELDK